MSHLKRKCSILAFFDFMAAFPSMLHDCIFLVMKVRQFPVGAMDFFRGVYSFNSALGNADGELVFLFWYLSGVLQGCPGSAFTFDLALDLFLIAFEKVISKKGRGIIRACADDIGAALKHYKSLSYLFPIFKQAQYLAGLTLKPLKCNIVPTSEKCSRLKAQGSRLKAQGSEALLLAGTGKSIG